MERENPVSVTLTLGIVVDAFLVSEALEGLYLDRFFLLFLVRADWFAFCTKKLCSRPFTSAKYPGYLHL